MIGQQISHYKVTALLGAGGMGEVYRATDTKLGRDVALKVLPTAFANDAERMARFQREAQVLASLNHRNIAAIYGLEDSGGVRALVMELVEGPTLAQRNAQGAVPLEEALVIAGQITDALEAAHEKGVVHRDLKPANIKVSPEGIVKVLDFGLAKALEEESSACDASNSPTLTAATKAGIILGTAAYMSPEQARGHAADRRADIWSFGVVLYEMLTGTRCFTGETVSDTLAAVLRAEIPLDVLPAGTPPAIRKLLLRCLERDRKRRLRDIGEARIAIEEYLANPADASVLMHAVAAPAPPLWRRVLPWAAAGVMALAFAVTLAMILRTPPPAAELARFELQFDTLSFSGTRSGARLTVSPDGQKIVFVASKTGSQSPQLYLRSMNNLEAVPIPGTEGGAQPFFSADSQWVGFSADNKLRKVSLGGGVPVTLCDSPTNVGTTATWADNGFIYFNASGVLNRVPEGGGTPQKVAEPDRGKGERFSWLQALPGSRGILVVVNVQNQFNIDVLSLDSGTRHRLVENGSWPRYLPTGHILYAQYTTGGESLGFTGGLLVVPFDLKKLAATGSPVPVIEGVHTGNGGAGYYDVTGDGTLVYHPGTTNTPTKTLAWLDRQGKITPIPAPPKDFRNLVISPDGTRAAVALFSGTTSDIHIYDLRRGSLQRITFEGNNTAAIFTTDGSRIIYSSSGSGSTVANLWWKPSDGSGAPERLTTSELGQHPSSVSPDGKLLAFSIAQPNTRGADIYVLPLEGDRKPRPILDSDFAEVFPSFSPDGKWLAYMSMESGKFEIYVQAFPGPGGKQQISTDGGVTPVWSRDGKQLFYNRSDALMAVDVSTQPTFHAGKPRVLASALRITQIGHRNFAVAPDGRILIAQRPEQAQEDALKLRIVQNFAADVRRRISPAKP